MESAYIVSRSRLVSNDDLSQDSCETEHRCFERAIDAIEYYKSIILENILWEEYKKSGVMSYLMSTFYKELYFVELDENGKEIQESMKSLLFDCYGQDEIQKKSS